jgi:hypothetical protein
MSDRNFDAYMEEWSQPLPEAPKPDPVEVPMEKTVLVDYATEVENRKNYLEEGREPAFKKKREEGTVAPPVDVYEPGFRSDLVAAIKSYWKKQRETREKVQKIREKTGIGRYY